MGTVVYVMLRPRERPGIHRPSCLMSSQLPDARKLRGRPRELNVHDLLTLTTQVALLASRLNRTLTRYPTGYATGVPSLVVPSGQDTLPGDDALTVS